MQHLLRSGWLQNKLSDSEGEYVYIHYSVYSEDKDVQDRARHTEERQFESRNRSFDSSQTLNLLSYLQANCDGFRSVLSIRIIKLVFQQRKFRLECKIATS